MKPDCAHARRHNDAGIIWCLDCKDAIGGSAGAFADLLRALPGIRALNIRPPLQLVDDQGTRRRDWRGKPFAVEDLTKTLHDDFHNR